MATTQLPPPAATVIDRGDQERLENQRRLELALEAGAMGVWEWRIAEDRVIWSPAVERIHGLAPGTFDGSPAMQRDDLHPEDRAMVAEQIRQAVEQRAPLSMVYRIIRPDDEVRWLQAHARVVVDGDGRPERMVGVVRDITDERDIEHVRSRARLAELERTRMAAILESITDAFTVLDGELRIVYLNGAAARLIGVEAPDAIGQRPWDLVPEAEDTAFIRAYQRVLRDHQPATVEEYFAPRDRWYEATIYPLDEGLSVYTRDVTMRKRALELTMRLARQQTLRGEVSTALAEERDLHRLLARCCEAMVQTLGVAFARIWTIDEAGTTLLLQASAGMYTHLNGPHAAVPVGKFKIGLIAAERAPHLTNDVLHDPRVGDPAWAAREKLVAFAGYPMVVDGELVGVMAMFARTPLPDDTLNALASIADTIAQGIVRVQTERELDARLADLARSNSELEQFAYVASHDLQEPLRMVASYNQLLARRYKGKLGEDADEFIGYTVEGVTRMQRLINDLLAYSRVGSRRAEPSDVDLEKVLKATLSNLERAIADHGATITHDPLPHVLGDEGQLIQLLQNLIGNSIKFHGDASPQVHVGVVRDRQGLRFCVRDNGIGIDPQYFERIFVIFQRLHPREKYPGTGIGLAICKKIVERHGGKIWVESVPGGGSTVWFTLTRRS